VCPATYDGDVPEPLPIPTGDGATRLLPRLEAALAGTAPAVIPYAADSPVPDVPPADSTDLPDGLVLCVRTSGSTGIPKLTMLTGGALLASALGTHDVLGGPGQWLLALPAHHVAGIQVLIRSIVAGTTPVGLDLASGFTPEGFAAATARLTGARRYTALVPTQLDRLLGDATARAALTAYDAVLVGGAGTPPALLRGARAAGVRAVTTYGMSETAGGCVYDGRPLPGTHVVEDDGRILLGGATLAAGYLGRPDLTAAAFTADSSGTRWFRTDDVGHRDADGRWHVDGRLDDLINTGGLKVAPRVVEEALTAHVPGVREAVVVGVADPEWGQAVCAAVVVADGRRLLEDEVRDALRGHLPRHALPRRVAVVEALPLRGPGKPDRAAIRSVFAGRATAT
jgi:O-succinylbenzoic acid--CoA ligase